MYNRDSKIMRKLLGKSISDPPVNDLSTAASSSTTTVTSAAPVLYRPSRSQNAVFDAGVPIHALDVSPDRRSAALAGPHILKTLKLDDTKDGKFRFEDGVDLRAAILAKASSSSRSGFLADQLNIRDVKWHENSTIFTGCANGRIFAYDLARIGSGGGGEPLSYIQTQEDSRQVNTLAVNPHLKSWLLSGSQDGVARVFDISTPWHNRSGVLTFRQRFAPLKCIDSVREAKWSPRVGHEMACCTEAGVVLKWDVRNAGRPLLRINAHEKTCAAIDWHPDGIHLISAGWDSKLHVWDLSNHADKRQKPKFTISTPAPVATVAWRPGLWSATAQNRRVAQVAVSYDESTSKRYGSSVVHIWDLARPTIPYKEIERFDQSPSALYWWNQDLLWTAGHDSAFNQCDVAFASRVIDRQSTSAMAFSPRGDAIMFLDERSEPHRPRLASMGHHPDVITRSSHGLVLDPPMLSVSKSDSEEDIGSFLGSKKRPRKRQPSNRGSQYLSSTPPSSKTGWDEPKQPLALDQAIKVSGVFKSQQAMTTGPIPAAKSVDVYQFLTSVYLETLQKKLPLLDSHKLLADRVAGILEDFARAAEKVCQFRLCQTWRIIAFAVDVLLRRRGQYHLETRIARLHGVRLGDRRETSSPFRPGSGLLSSHYLHPDGEQTPRRSSIQTNIDARPLATRSLLSEEIESTSNVATPLAKPADGFFNTDAQDHYYQQYGKKLTSVNDSEPFSIDQTQRLPDKPLNPELQSSFNSQDSGATAQSSTEGYDFYDTDSLAKAIDMPAYANARSKSGRHDSQGSDYRMFSISDGRLPLPIGSQSPTKRSNRHNSGDSSAITEENNQGNSVKLDRPTQDLDSDESPTSAKAVHDKGNLPRTDSPEEVFMISQTTGLTDSTFPSQTSIPSQSSSQILEPMSGFEPSQDTEQASVSPSEQSHRSQPSQQPSQPGRTISPIKLTTQSYDSNPEITDQDYLHWPDDPDFPYPLSTSAPKTLRTPLSPLDPYTVIVRALAFECRTSSLNASAIVLLLKPLAPDWVIDSHRASAILRQHHSRLMGMGLFVEAATLRKLCIRGWPAGMAEWGDSYPAIFAPSQQSVKVGFLCSTCRKPRETEPSDDEAVIWTCKRCKSIMAPCAICGHREAEIASHLPIPLPEALVATSMNSTPSKLTTSAGAAPTTIAESGTELGSALSQWWYCPSCAHGGHASCLIIWHSLTPPTANDPSPKYSDGCCPLDGCGHACLPGRYRGETTIARSDELGRAASAETTRYSNGGKAGLSNGSFEGMPGSNANSRRSSPHRGSSVRSDEFSVPQSRAVGVARDALNKVAGGGGGGGGGQGGGGILSSSPGRTGLDRERRKSVKFATGTD